MSDSPNIGSAGDSSGDLHSGTALAGRTIVVTRAAQQADSLRKRLEELGAKTISHPVIRILPPEDIHNLDGIISRINEFDWIVFVSTNAVKFFIDRFVAIHGSIEKLKTYKIAAIGESTSQHLKRLGVGVDLIPPVSNSKSLGEVLRTTAVGKKLLVARADRRTATLTDMLAEANIEFEEVVAYRSRDVDIVDSNVATLMSEGRIDWVTITSGAIARSAVSVFGHDLRKAKLVSISPGTSAALRELGFEPDTEAEIYNMDGIVDAIKQYGLRRNS